MILVTLKLKVPFEKKVDVINIFEYLIGKIVVKKGCATVNLYSDTSNDDSLLYQEEWNSQQNLWKHIRSNDFRKIMAAMELANEPPEIRFYIISSSPGFELVEKLRK